jgi:hypothetical protein
MIYQLRRRNKSKWSGVLAYNSTFLTFNVAISAKTRKLKTGLKTLEEQHEMETKLQMPKGSLTDMISPNGLIVSEFWREFKLDIPAEGITLDTDNALDELYVKALLASDIVVGRNKLSDKAVFELHNEEEAAVVINKEREHKTKAYSIYGEMSVSDKLDYALSKGHNAHNASPSVIDNIVGTAVDSNPSAFVTWIQNSSYKKIIKLYRYVTAGIVRKAGNNFFYNEVQIGVSELTAIQYLEKPSNQSLVTGIIQEYEAFKDLNKVEVPLEEKVPPIVEEVKKEQPKVAEQKVPPVIDKTKGIEQKEQDKTKTLEEA